MPSLVSNWDLDGFVDEQRYYCSETTIDVNSLPAPKAILAGDARSYIDTAIELGKTYHVVVGSVKNAVEKLSDEIKVYAFNSNLFAINSDFESNLIDKTGKVWTAHGNASVNNSALVLDGDGDYLTCSASDNMHFTNSEDVTIRAKIKVSQFKPSNIAVIFSTWNSTTSNGYDIRLTLSGIMVVFWNISFYPTFSYSIPIGVEFELSIERRNMVWNAYINGEKIGSSVLQSSNYSRVNPSLFYLGTGVYEGYGTDRDLNGTIRKFQLIKGLAVGNGEPTTPRI